MRKFIGVYIDLENVAGILDLDKMLQDIILEEDKEAPEEYIFAVKFACGNTNSISKMPSEDPGSLPHFNLISIFRLDLDSNMSEKIQSAIAP